MTYLLDTDVVSAFNKATLSAKLAHWLGQHEQDCFISLVSIAEMRHGLTTAPEAHRPKLAQRMADTEARFTESFLPVDVDVLMRWKGLLTELKSVQRTMTCEDSLIAATCLAGGHMLATNNLRHFEPARPVGLEVVNPLAA